jgi:hypothetical protein
VSFTELASWGWYGLKSVNTVAGYHKWWQDAVAEGLADPVELGDPYEEPVKEWTGWIQGKVDTGSAQEPADEPFDEIVKGLGAIVVSINDLTNRSRDLELDETDRAELLKEQYPEVETAARRLKKYLTLG